MFFLHRFRNLLFKESRTTFGESLSVQERLNRTPQDATWPGERVVVWTYSERPELPDLLARLRGDHTFGDNELVVTDYGDRAIEPLLEVAHGHRRIQDLTFERTDGVSVLHLPRTFLASNGLALRKLLWLLPHDSIYLVTHESVNPRA